MIRICSGKDTNEIFEIINDAAEAYKGIIPADCWKEPYMPMHELEAQLQEGVQFWCYHHNGKILGVMGLQDKNEVILVRHAYVRTANRNGGIGRQLLSYLKSLTTRPILIGTWADAHWAIGFYKKNGFTVLPAEKKNVLLRKYWNISQRQLESSVVLASPEWTEGNFQSKHSFGASSKSAQ